MGKHCYCPGAVVLLENLAVNFGTAVAHGVVHVDYPRECLLQGQSNHRGTLVVGARRQSEPAYGLLHCAYYKVARIAYGAVKIKYYGLYFIALKISFVHKKQYCILIKK